MSTWKITGEVPQPDTTDTSFEEKDRFQPAESSQGEGAPEPKEEEPPKPKEESTPPSETEIPAEAKTEKAANRFQELANENKVLRDQINLLLQQRNQGLPPAQQVTVEDIDVDSIDSDDKLKAYLKTLKTNFDANRRELESFRSEARRETFEGSINKTLAEAFVSNPDAKEFAEAIKASINEQMAKDRASGLPFDPNRYSEFAKSKVVQYQGVINKYKIPLEAKKKTGEKVEANKQTPATPPRGTQTPTVNKLPRTLDDAIRSGVDEMVRSLQ